MIKVYYEIVSGIRLLPVISPNEEAGDSLTEDVPFWRKALAQNKDSKFVEKVYSPKEADYILIPHVFKSVRHNADYISRLKKLSSDHKKKILIFTFQDNTDPIHFPDAIIFRASAYKSHLLKNEVGLPYLVEDLLDNRELTLRVKPKMPTVGFVGWAGFKSIQQSVKANVKEIMRMIVSLATTLKPLGIKRKGVFIRQEMLKVLSSDGQVKTNFIIRSSYSGHTGTAENDINKLREEYIDNIVSSDITLSPRGEGNASQRFFEVLSLGRIPLLVDTDGLLPLEEIIPYDEFVIKVPYNKRKYAGQYINDFFSHLPDDKSYEDVQRKARFYFEKYLSFNGFYTHIFRDGYIREIDKNIFG